jgi:hypothetical protein
MKKSIHLNWTFITILSALMMFFVSCEKDSNEPPLEPTDQKTAKIGPAGGTIELSNGVQVIIPSGAISVEKEIKISSFKPEDFFDGDVKNYYVVGCEPDGQLFSKPVEIYFPVPKSLENGDFDGLAGLIDPESNAIEVYSMTGLTIDGKSMIKIETDHFSKYAGHFWEYPPFESSILEIPHYNQGSSPYCWAACLQMVCEAIKHDEINEIPDIIGYTGVSEAGLDQYEFRYNSKIASLVKLRTGVSPERQLFPKGSALAMDSYLKDRLALGFPVLVFSPVEEHAFVVIGYKGNTFYINNPASVTYDGSLSYQTKKWTDFKVGEMEINAKFVTLSIPANITCSSRLQSVNLADKGMTFSQAKPAPQAPITYNFRYDHQKTSGYSFKNKDGKVFDTIPGDVTDLELTEIQLCNTSQTQSKSFNVWIDIWGQNNKKLHKSFSPKASIIVSPNSYKVHQVSIPVAEFRDSSSTATKYRMQITAVEAGGGVMDDASVFFTINPPPSLLEFKFKMKIKYKDGSTAASGLGTDENEPPTQFQGSWKENTYTVQLEASENGHNYLVNATVKCSSDRKIINSFYFEFRADGEVLIKLKATNMNLIKDGKTYKIDLLGTATCTPIDLTDIKLYSFFSDVDYYYCDETSYFILRLPE